MRGTVLLVHRLHRVLSRAQGTFYHWHPAWYVPAGTVCMYALTDMPRSLTARDLSPIASGLRTANAAFARHIRANPSDRQPIHSVYGGAHLFAADTAPKLGALALEGTRRVRAARRALRQALELRDRGRALRTRFARAWSRSSGASRSRISGSISKTATATGQTPRKTGTRARPPKRSRPARARDAPAVHRHPDQADVGRAAQPQPAHARPVRDVAGAGETAPAAAELRGHDPEGDDAGTCHGRARAAARSSAG